MPILVPKGLPAYKTLKEENIFVMDEKRGQRQDIRPLRVAIVNLMPTKETTEEQLIRLLANTPLQVEVQLLSMGSHDSKNTDRAYLDNFYKTFDEVKHQKYDGMIITGAPVEFLPFEEVDYWKELTEIMDYCRDNVFSTIHICWGAQAGLYRHFGINKHVLDKKLFGVFLTKVKEKKSELMRGFDEEFYAPQSRHTQVDRDEILKVPDLKILADSEETGPHIVATKDKSLIFIQGHMEYDKDSLKNEYDRDIAKGMDMEVPKNYFRNDDPKKGVLFRWRGHGNLFYANWLNFVYQGTPYNLNDLPKLREKKSHKEA